jgi:hypothetical protein
MRRTAQSADSALNQIAQRAAQLIAEHGIQDYALAKRKALRQLGLPSGHSLPGNDAVDAALLEYRQLFEPEAQQSELDTLRRQALQAMIDLNPFEPILVGGVATGAISRHSDIELELYLDATKTFEQFLMKEGILYESRDRAGQSHFLLFAEPANVLVRILPEQLEHRSHRTRDEQPNRLTRAQLEKLLRDQDAVTVATENG